MDITNILTKFNEFIEERESKIEALSDKSIEKLAYRKQIGAVEYCRDVLIENSKTLPIKFKIVGGTDPELDVLYIDQIRSMNVIEDKNGQKSIIVSYWDDEFCIVSSVVCEKLIIDNEVIEEKI